jgi:DNA-binding MarR family transcriptional regulator
MSYKYINNETGMKLKKSALENAYFRFNKLMETLEQGPSFPKLDEIEKKLLDSIAEASYAGKPFLVSDVIFANQVGSPATLSRRLNSLVEKGLIVYSIGDDSRKKFLELTPKSKKYFAKLEELILMAGSKGSKS